MHLTQPDLILGIRQQNVKLFLREPLGSFAPGIRTRTTRERLKARTISGFDTVSPDGSCSSSLPRMSGDGRARYAQHDRPRRRGVRKKPSLLAPPSRKHRLQNPGFPLNEHKFFVRSRLPVAGNEPGTSGEKCGIAARRMPLPGLSPAVIPLTYIEEQCIYLLCTESTDL